MNTSMTATRRPVRGRTALDVDRLLMTVADALRNLPSKQQLEPISVVDFLARYARRLHGYDRTAADATLRGALKRVGNSHTRVSPTSLARRIDLAYQSVKPGRIGGAR